MKLIDDFRSQWIRILICDQSCMLQVNHEKLLKQSNDNTNSRNLTKSFAKHKSPSKIRRDKKIMERYFSKIYAE